MKVTGLQIFGIMIFMSVVFLGLHACAQWERLPDGTKKIAVEIGVEAAISIGEYLADVIKKYGQPDSRDRAYGGYMHHWYQTEKGSVLVRYSYESDSKKWRVSGVMTRDTYSELTQEALNVVED